MALAVGILLAVFVLGGGWDWAAVAGGGAIELGEAWLWWRWSHRRRPAVGVEVLIGRTVDVNGGWTEIVGERWRVSGVDSGGATVVGVEGLTLLVEPRVGS